MSSVHMFYTQAARPAARPETRPRVDLVAFACAIIAACGFSEYAVALLTVARTLF